MNKRSGYFLAVTILLISLFGGTSLIFAASPTTQSAHDFNFTSIDGADLPLADFKGKAVLIVNTASMCGFPSQYRGLQALWDSYRARGLVVLGVPSDDFGGQELDSAAEVKSFCTINKMFVEIPARHRHPTMRFGNPFIVGVRGCALD